MTDLDKHDQDEVNEMLVDDKEENLENKYLNLMNEINQNNIDYYKIFDDFSFS